jgi:murein L,D-transpeptidase YcbB/YkuD
MRFIYTTLLQRVYSIEDRAFSHGCIRVEKPVELATQILKNDKKWDERKIREAMNGGEEKWYTLQNKILFTLVILPLG